jgi:hypothetical protein
MTEVFNVETGGEGDLEVEDEGVIATDENGVVDVDGKDIDEVICGDIDGEDGRIHDGMREAEGDEPTAKEGVPSTGDFDVGAIEGLGELANETNVCGGGRIVWHHSDIPCRRSRRRRH